MTATQASADSPASPPATDANRQTTLIARIAWIIVALVTFGLDLYAIPIVYRQAGIGCPDPGPCLDGTQLTVSQIAQMHAQGVASSAISAYSAYTVALETLPALVCVARPP